MSHSIVSGMFLRVLFRQGPLEMVSPESTCQCRGHGFDPWSGKNPHAAGQLRPCTTTTEACTLEPVLHERAHSNEKPTHRNEE